VSNTIQSLPFNASNMNEQQLVHNKLYEQLVKAIRFSEILLFYTLEMQKTASRTLFFVSMTYMPKLLRKNTTA